TIKYEKLVSSNLQAEKNQPGDSRTQVFHILFFSHAVNTWFGSHHAWDTYPLFFLVTSQEKKFFFPTPGLSAMLSAWGFVDITFQILFFSHAINTEFGSHHIWDTYSLPAQKK